MAGTAFAVTASRDPKQLYCRKENTRQIRDQINTPNIGNYLPNSETVMGKRDNDQMANQ
jgi:hypothetical protein